jgi:hypothetical protein
MRTMIIDEQKDLPSFLILEIFYIVLENAGVHLIRRRNIILATMSAYQNFGVSC